MIHRHFVTGHAGRAFIPHHGLVFRDGLHPGVVVDRAAVCGLCIAVGAFHCEAQSTPVQGLLYGSPLRVPCGNVRSAGPRYTLTLKSGLPVCQTQLADRAGAVQLNASKLRIVWLCGNGQKSILSQP